MEETQTKNLEDYSKEELIEVINKCENIINNQQQSLYQMQKGYAIQRLNFLFKVLENRRLFDMDFADDCAKEIQETLKRDPDEIE